MRRTYHLQNTDMTNLYLTKKGPRGAQGDEGKKGEKGDKGSKGD